MGVFGMITSVVLIVMISVVAMVGMTSKSKNARTQAQNGDKETDKRFAALEERVRVLEKIATDRGSRLKEEIDAL